MQMGEFTIDVYSRRKSTRFRELPSDWHRRDKK
jgi:hypothetical protein